MIPPGAALVDLVDAHAWLLPAFLDAAEADALFAELLDGLPWCQDQVRLFGRATPIPRRHLWVGDEGVTYRWSGLSQRATGWPAALEPLRAAVSAATAVPFNAALANRYADGRDSMGWHADDEPELGPDPSIASVSLGATRDFVLRHRATGARVVVPLPHGSLLFLGPGTQGAWQHALPRRLRCASPRINLTFRRVLAPR